MNRQNFIQAGGFPLETETLDEMQKAFGLLNSLGNIAGNFSIISGCVTTGALVSDGVVYINGEVLEFRGGQLGTDVIIVEEVTAQEFEDGNDKDVVYIRYATFGIGGVSYPWTNFKRPKTTTELTEEKEEKSVVSLLIDRIDALEARSTANVPIGMIAIWDRPANEIPVGWVEHQPLRGRMPIGLDPNDGDLDALGVASGSKIKTIQPDELPNPHGVNIYGLKSDGNQTLILGDSNVNQPNLQEPYLIVPAIANKSFSILNPYRVVHFIKYVG
jgi:hypothetical protein